jgi:hypothetical protein
MKKLLFALLLTPVLATAQLRDSVKINAGIYEAIYSEKLEIIDRINLFARKLNKVFILVRYLIKNDLKNYFVITQIKC